MTLGQHFTQAHIGIEMFTLVGLGHSVSLIWLHHGKIKHGQRSPWNIGAIIKGRCFGVSLTLYCRGSSRNTPTQEKNDVTNGHAPDEKPEK